MENGQREVAAPGSNLAWNRHGFFNIGDPKWLAAKQGVRERVADHLEKYMSRSQRTQCCMTMPGAEWKFEKTFAERFGWSPFWLGVEADAGVVEYGVRHMPGRPGVRRHTSRIHTPEGDFSGYETPGEARLVHADLRSLVRACRAFADVRRDPEWIGHWRKARLLLWNWSMFWFDGFATLTTAIEDLASIDRCLNAWVDVVPFAITLFCGHDTGTVSKLIAAARGDAAESRATVLAEFLDQKKYRTCDITAVERYGTMAVVMGLLRSRSPRNAPDITE